MTSVPNSCISISAQDKETLAGGLDDRESRRENLTASHRAELDILDEQISSYETSLPPIHALPTEIIGEIFWKSIEKVELSPSNYRFALPSAVLLSMVCRRWRDIAVSTPLLWSYFQIHHTGDQHESSFNKLLDGLRLFLDRSKKYPLTFTLWWTHRPRINRIDNLKSTLAAGAALSIVMSVLLENGGRWRDVSSNWPSFKNTLLQPCDKGLAESTRQLKRLELRCVGDPLVSLLRDAFTHSDAPMLDSVHLVCGTTADSVYLLPKARKLKAEKVVFTPYDGDVVEAPDTTDVSISARSSLELGGVLNHCNLPNLKTLSVSGWRGFDSDWGDLWDVHWDISALANLFRVSGFGAITGLTTFRLIHIPVPDIQLIHVLELVPTLEELTIYESCNLMDLDSAGEDVPHDQPVNFIITSFFSERLNRSSSPCFLPRLKSLQLSVSGEGLDQQALVDAVSSRTPHSTILPNQEFLKSVVVSLKSAEATDYRVLSTMEDIREGGVEVAIIYP